MADVLLRTTNEVMDALGGTREVAAITGRTYNAALNWRNFLTFPSNTYLVMQTALHARGLVAPASLWGMTVTGAGEQQRASA